MGTGSFIIHVKTEDIYKDNAENVESRFNTSNYEVNWPLPMGKNKKVIGMMKNELGGKIREFVGLRPKTSSYLKDSNDESKKAKDTKKCILKRKLKFKDYKNCLKTSQIVNIANYVEKKKKLMLMVLKKIKNFMKKKLLLNDNKDLKVEGIMFLLKKLTRSRWVLKMIKNTVNRFYWDILTWNDERANMEERKI